MHQSGITNVVASSGTALTESQIRLINRLTKNITVVFDGDEAGKRASYKAAIMSLPFLIPNKSLQFVNLPEDKDPDKDPYQPRGRY